MSGFWYHKTMRKLRIPEGPIVRNRKHQKAYDTYRFDNPPAGCQFCELASGTSHIRRTYQLFWVIDNLFPYFIWDGSHTGEHLLLIPKRHIDSIAHFTPSERKEYVAILAEFEANGYSIYARAAQNKRKSVVHQHTHLIEVGKPIKTQVFIKKPHINIVR